ncbi:MAG TPA: MauE/DoxX family redox-associated membrane protein [Niastella sp.]|nr:MauE/DoxX family redox-associated membrane protein [Niastella sp.]
MKKELFPGSHLSQRSYMYNLIAFSWLKRNTVLDIISSLLIVLFIYTALSKLGSYNSFTTQLSKSPFITSYANIIAWSLPAVEILISLLLVFKGTRLYGLYASFFMMSLFTAYLIIMLNFSYHIPCSCGGVLQYLSWNEHIVFNTFFIIIAGAGAVIKANETNN